MSLVFERRLPAEVFAWADALPLSAAEEVLPLARAAGRVLAQALIAAGDLPPRPIAGVDGFALRAADTLGAGDYNPLPLRLRPDGQPLGAGAAASVMRGDPLPEGAGAVLALEQAEVLGGTLEVVTTVAPGEGIVERGQECRVGETLLPADRPLRSQDLAWLALAGHETLALRAMPTVRILLAGRYARDADGPMLAALAARDGGHVESIQIAADGPALDTALKRPGADLILVAGGTGFAARDHAAASLARVGEVDIRGVAIHPGDTLTLGRVGSAGVLLLPGTPLACFAAYDLVGARALRRLSCLAGRWPYRSRSLPLARKLASAIGRMDLCRVRMVDGRVEPLAVTDDQTLATVVRADGFVVVPADSEGYAEDSPVTVYFYSNDECDDLGRERE